MKITVELSDSELEDVLRFSGEKKKGPAIRKFVVSELMLRRRREISQKALAGQWSVELPPIEKLRKDRSL
jgi:hypothetical protein